MKAPLFRKSEPVPYDTNNRIAQDENFDKALTTSKRKLSKSTLLQFFRKMNVLLLQRALHKKERVRSLFPRDIRDFQ